MTKRLTPQQRRFIEEYLVDLNATQAAIRAGYSPKTAQEQASRLLSNVMVQEAVTEAQEARARRTEITQDKVLRELAITAFSSIWDFAIDDKGQLALASKADEASIRAVSSLRRKVREVGFTPVQVEGKTVLRALYEYDTEVRLWPKVQALKLAGQHLGLFKERTPLEELLAALPPQLAGALRQALAALLVEGSGEAGDPSRQLRAPNATGAGPSPGDGTGGDAPGSVAGAGTAQPGPADAVPLFPVSGEEPDGSGDRPA